MPTSTINGRDVLVFVDIAGGTSYNTVVCLTSNTITNELTSLDASSKCGNEFVPGKKFSASISGEGFVVDQDTGTATNKGYNELYKAFTDRAVVGIKFGKATPTTGDAVYTGLAFIDNIEAVAADDELTTFTVNFVCANPPFTQTITY